MTPQNEKSVRFAEERNVTTIFENYDESGLDSSASSCARCRRPRYRDIYEQLEVSAQILKRLGYGILLRDSFGGSDGERIQRNLNAFAQIDQSRGLERFLSYHHDEERHVAKNNAVRAVVVGQKILKRNSRYSTDEIWERLAKTIRKHSTDAKGFARRLGIADELAATIEREDTKVASVLVKQMNCGNARKTLRRVSSSDQSGASTIEFAADDSDIDYGSRRRVSISKIVASCKIFAETSILAEDRQKESARDEQAIVERRSQVARTA